jgi:hypothetical protein
LTIRAKEVKNGLETRMKIPSDYLRLGLAILLLVHAVAHIPGFLVAWRLAVLPELPYRTTLLGGTIDIGPLGIRLVGVLWLTCTLGFLAAALLVFRGSASWPALTLAVVCLSLLLCLAGLPDTRIGLAVNVLLLLVLGLTVRTSWLGDRLR